MRILFIGDAAATGFGTVTSDIGRNLLELGEDVRFLSQNAAGFEIPEPLGSRTFRLTEDARPEHVLGALTGEGMPDKWAAEAIIILGDFFAARWIAVDQRIQKVLRSMPSYHYCPVEGVDLPPTWAGLWSIVRPVAMTEFGADEIEKVVGYRPPMIYHGVDQSVFYPITPQRPSAHTSENGSRAMNKRQAKIAFELDPNRIILLRTDRHMPRKRYNAMLRAVVPVMERNTNVDLVIHCRIHDQGGFLMDSLAKYPKMLKAGRFKATLAHDSWQGLSREELNLLYNAADVYVQNSAEGFGLTVAEAIACGVPAVGIDYSAVPEVIGPAGLLAKVDHLEDNIYDHFWAAEDPIDWGEKVERLIRNPKLRKELGSAGPAHVAANFNWTRAAEQFRDLLHSALAEVAA